MMRVLNRTCRTRGSICFLQSRKPVELPGWLLAIGARARTTDRDPDASQDTTNAQAKALISWCATKDHRQIDPERHPPAGSDREREQ